MSLTDPARLITFPLRCYRQPMGIWGWGLSVLRVRLKDLDIARLRLVRRADALWEVRRSLLDINRGANSSPLTGVGQSADSVKRWRPLLQLAPVTGDAPSFLSPTCGVSDIQEGLQSLVAMPSTALRTAAARFATTNDVAGWVHEIARGDQATMRRLAAVTDQYFNTLIAPHWAWMRRTVQDDVQARVEAMSEGLEALLRSLHPTIIWEPPYLIVEDDQIQRELHLEGRGMALQPSFFGQGHVSCLENFSGPLVLVYPVRRPPRPSARYAPPLERSLDSLLGRTRSAALAILSKSSCTTTELASKLGVSLPSASEQTKILREAGLINTSPQGKAAIHSASILGLRLLLGHV